MLDKQTKKLYVLTIVSAFLYGISFVYIDFFWWGMILALPIFWIIVYKTTTITMPKVINLGLLWGIIHFSLHFMWFFIFLREKMYASFNWALCLYIVIIGYFCCLLIVFFVVSYLILQKITKKFLKIGLAIVLPQLFFMFCARYAFVFLGIIAGYPFFSPYIPLVNIITLQKKSIPNIQHLIIPYTTEGNRLYYEPQLLSLWYFQKIAALSLIQKNTVFVTGESAYPFPLNIMPQECLFLSSILTKEQHILLGAEYQNIKLEKFQALYWISAQGIEKIYLKSISVPFFERMPTFLKKCTKLRAVLNASYDFSTVALEKPEIWTLINETIRITPAICGDFFMGYYRSNRKMPHKTRLLLIVNDGWYVAYFKKIMENLTQLDAMRLETPIIYVGHFSVQLMDTKESLCKYICSKMLKMLV